MKYFIIGFALSLGLLLYSDKALMNRKDVAE